MRSISSALKSAERSTKAKPYIEILFEDGFGGGTTYTYTTADTPSRIKAIKHTEQPYSSSCIIVLRNNDRALPNLKGFHCTVKYGYYITVDSTEVSASPPLWVYQHTQISRMGDVDVVLQLFDYWGLLAEMYDIAEIIGATPPYYELDYADEGYTIYDIMEAIIEATGDFDLLALEQDDGIVGALLPDFVINSVPYCSAADDVYRLINMTKLFLREEYSAAATAAFRLVYPPGNSVDQIYYSDKPAGAFSTVDIMLHDGGSTGSHPVASGLYAFDAQGYRWALVYEDSTLYIVPSDDEGASWGSPITLGANYVCVAIDTANSRVHCVRYSGDDVYYRSFTVVNDGTISWDAAEQLIYTATGSGAMVVFASVFLDSAGYPWVGVSTYYGTNKGSVVVIKSSTKTGTWTDDAGFPYTVVTDVSTPTGYSLQKVFIVALASQSMYVIWTQQATKLSGRLWTGSEWNAVDSLFSSSTLAAGAGCSVDVDSSYNITVAYVSSSSNYIRSIRKPSGLAWAGDVVVAGGDYNTDWPRLWRDGQGNLYCLLPKDAGDIWRIKRKADYTWENYEVAATIADQHAGWNLRFAPVEGTADELVIRWVNDANNAGAWVYGTLEPSYQFKEFEFYDHEKIPHQIVVIANRVDKEDGTWDEAEILTGTYPAVAAPSNNLPPLVRYAIAEALTVQDDVDNRAQAIAVRAWMEEPLGRILVQHDCDLELFDKVQAQDKRSTSSYITYPTAAWSDFCVVGSLVHLFQANRGVYTLEITLNGISSAMPVSTAKSVTAAAAAQEAEEPSGSWDVTRHEIPPSAPPPPTDNETFEKVRTFLITPAHRMDEAQAMYQYAGYVAPQWWAWIVWWEAYNDWEAHYMGYHVDDWKAKQ